MLPKSSLKAGYQHIVVPLLRLLFSLFFDKKYLTGRYFNSSVIGWRWAWRSVWLQKMVGFNRHVPWPVSPFIAISNPMNIVFDPDDLNNFQGYGCYFQNFGGRIFLGKGTYVAPNVGIITANHDLLELSRHSPGKDVVIGRNCWIGMNAVILPGVELGDSTIVGAGAVVTKSFSDGYCVVAGVPAQIIRHLK